MSRSIRLFVAALPGRAVARSLLDSIREMPLPAHRLVPVEQVHLTLQFLGETPRDRLPMLSADLDRLGRSASPMRLQAVRLITLPRTRARVVAAETNLPPSLQCLFDACAALPGAQRRGGSPTPHLTLARLGRGTRMMPISQRIEPITFDVREMHLVESDLGPEGATHTILRTAALNADQ